MICRVCFDVTPLRSCLKNNEKNHRRMPLPNCWRGGAEDSGEWVPKRAFQPLSGGGGGENQQHHRRPVTLLLICLMDPDSAKTPPTVTVRRSCIKRAGRWSTNDDEAGPEHEDGAMSDIIKSRTRKKRGVKEITKQNFKPKPLIHPVAPFLTKVAQFSAAAPRFGQ